jgi:hypothetical protein
MKVLIKHKDGSLSGPHEVDLDRGIQIKTRWICRTVIEALGLEVIPYEEPRRKFFVDSGSYATAYSACDLGDFKECMIAFYPHKDSLSFGFTAMEIKPGEVIVSREKLETIYRTSSLNWDAFCKELGLE